MKLDPAEDMATWNRHIVGVDGTCILFSVAGSVAVSGLTLRST